MGFWVNMRKLETDSALVSADTDNGTTVVGDAASGTIAVVCIMTVCGRLTSALRRLS